MKVIEPHAMTFEYWQKHLSKNLSENTKVLYQKDINDYFSDRSLLDFLAKRPSIVTYFASFNTHQNFYKAFLSYKYSTKLEDNLQFISNKKFATYLQTYKHLDTDEFLSTLKEKKNLSEWDLLSMAFMEIAHYKSPLSEKQI